MAELYTPFKSLQKTQNEGVKLTEIPPCAWHGSHGGKAFNMWDAESVLIDHLKYGIFDHTEEKLALSPQHPVNQ